MDGDRLSLATRSPASPSAVYGQWLVLAVAVLIGLWGVIGIGRELLTYTHGRLANATVVGVWQSRGRSPVVVRYEAHTEHGLIRGEDFLITPWPPSSGDQIEIAYLAIGGWRHSMALRNRSWVNHVIPRGGAVVFGLVVGAGACLNLRGFRVTARERTQP